MPRYLLKDLPKQKFQSGPRQLDKGTTYDVQTNVGENSTTYILTPPSGSAVHVTEEEFRELNSPRHNPKFVPLSTESKPEESSGNMGEDLANNRPSINPQQSAYSQDPAGYDHFGPYGASPGSQAFKNINLSKSSALNKAGLWKICVGDIIIRTVMSSKKLVAMGDGRNISFWAQDGTIIDSWPMESSDHGTVANEILKENLPYVEVLELAREIGLVRGSVVINPDNSWGLVADGVENFTSDTIFKLVVAVENQFGVEFSRLTEINGEDPSALLSQQIGASVMDVPPELFEEIPDHEQSIDGGRADGLEASEFDKKDLMEGAMVELEHTDDIDVAIEIAMDHIDEDPEYYKKLRTMHSSLKLTNASGEYVAFWIKDGEFYEVPDRLDHMDGAARLGLIDASEFNSIVDYYPMFNKGYIRGAYMTERGGLVFTDSKYRLTIQKIKEIAFMIMERLGISASEFVKTFKMFTLEAGLYHSIVETKDLYKEERPQELGAAEQ